jgi:hypothetical protein
MGLSRIQKGVKKLPRKLLLYAVEGIGKSTFASMSPSPIFLPTEEGLNDIDCESFPIAESLDELLQNMATLIKEDHQYKTVVIDTIDWLERLVFDEVCKEHKKNNIEDIGYAKGYKFALGHWNRVLKGLDILRREKGMLVILLAHSQIERFESPTSESYDRYTPRIHKHASSLIREWCDEVFFAMRQVSIKREDKGFNQTKARAIDTDKRMLFTTERASHMAKNRLGMPDELDFAWASYAEYL